ncbi:MAG: glycoside hydrolase domain-containing protein [Bacteroidales bacterium]
MKKPIILTTLLVLISTLLNAQDFKWTTAPQPWPESFGSQRAVLEVSQPAIAVEVDLLWRRHDKNPEERQLLVVEASSGDTIINILREEVNAEHCHFFFGPVLKPGSYYVYYLPFAVVEGWGYFGKNYLKQEPRASQAWLDQNPVKKAAKAKVLRIECRTSFDSFYPMEVTPTKHEKEAFLKKFSDPVLIFTESRDYPIRMKDEIPLKWIRSGPSSLFQGEALQNEYFAFQVGLFASAHDIAELEINPGRLTLSGKSDGNEILMTCFNTQGVDPYGTSVVKKLNIPVSAVQALWFGADVPEQINPGVYIGQITLKAKNHPEQKINVILTVKDGIIADRGDSEPWRHSRLRWLNSVAGSDGNPVPPYPGIRKTADHTFEVAGHIISLAKSGLPQLIRHKEATLLAGPVSLVIETPEGTIPNPFAIEGTKLTEGRYSQSAVNRQGNLQVNYHCQMDYDGYLKLTVTIRNLSLDKPQPVRDIRLLIPMATEKARYMMGMGLPGGLIPPVLESKWKGPFDSFWIGDYDIGIWCELRGSSYCGPLLNLYHPDPPDSWNNQGKGGFSISRDTNQVTARVYSGARAINPGDSILFEWAMLITPVKELNTASQFTDRYYHRGDKPAPGKADFDAGVKIINVHHANEYNPYINYPFIATREMKSFIDSIHAMGKKVKIYYTVRELTNHVAEIWALRSLGFEILDNGRGGGYPWLREHFVSGYTPQWYQHFPDGRVDASVLSSPGDSRWLNYYIEGLAWLVKNMDIDGLYLDDVTFDRRILQRMRRVMAQAKPGCLIDLHSNTGFSIGPANQYAGFFPYVDKLWFGESFQYDKMSPENWLVEVSGIPFGLMGDMLQGGGNRWLGMLFGMTVRYPWTSEGVLCDPLPVWKIWDQFRIQDSKMVGFWDNKCPVSTDHPEVKVTVYSKKDKILLSIGNFTDQTQSVKLRIDWSALGLNPDQCRMFAPEIENFQISNTLDPNDQILVEARKGFLLYIEKIQ